MLIIQMNKGAEVRQNKQEREHGKRWRSFNDVLDNTANTEPRYMSKRISYRDLNHNTENPTATGLNVEDIKLLNDRKALLSYDDKKHNRHKIYQKLERINQDNAPTLFNPNNSKTEIII